MEDLISQLNARHIDVPVPADELGQVTISRAANITFEDAPDVELPDFSDGSGSSTPEILR